MFKRLLLLFLALATVFLAATGYVYDMSRRNEQAIVEAGEAHAIALQVQAAASALNDVAADLRILASLVETHGDWGHGDAEAQRRLEAGFLNLALHKQRYDQVRVLDSAGMEVVRINNPDGRPVLVPPEQLQSKTNRYYFTETIRLGPGQIYISPLDLNVENDVIEQPLKPMIRFGTPVFDRDGRKQGIVVLNYLAQNLIADLKRLGRGLLGQFLLLNEQGYWLIGADPGQEWGFMYADRQNQTFANAFPEDWRRIASTNAGQFHSSQGLFTFTTVFPRVLSQPSTASDDTVVIAPRDDHWKMLSRIPPEALEARIHPPLPATLAMLAGGLGLLAGISWLIAKTQARQALAVAALRDSEIRLTNQLRFTETLIDSIPAPTFFKDRECRYLGCNTAFEAFIGLPLRELTGKTVHEIAPPELANLYDDMDRALLNHPGRQVYESEVLFADGNRHDVLFYKNTFVNAEGELSGLIGVMLDITDRKQAEEKLRRSEDLLQRTGRLAKVGGWELSFSDLLPRWSEEVRQIHQVAPEYQPTLEEMLNFYPAEAREQIAEALRLLIEQGTPFDLELPFVTAGNHHRWVHIHGDSEIEQGKTTRLFGALQDITERKEMEEQIKHLAQHDALTGLPNRNLLQDRYRQGLYRAERNQKRFAVLMLDLDGFKAVNDTLGHENGDRLLRQVAERLAQCVRKTDTVCRLGGDEFVLLLGDLERWEDAARVAETVLKTIGQHYILEWDQPATVGVSIGIACYPGDGARLDVLLKNADTAMYRAKDGGRNRYEFFAGAPKAAGAEPAPTQNPVLPPAP